MRRRYGKPLPAKRDVQAHFDFYAQVNEAAKQEGVEMNKESKAFYGEPDTGLTQGAIKLSWSVIKEGERVGVFWFDDETQKFAFKGDLDSSAEIFAAAVLNQMNKGR